MNRILRTLGLLSLFTLSISAPGLTLSQEGQSSYVIVVAADAIPAERTAAHELQTHLATVTGAQLPILEEGTAPLPGKAFVVGPSRALNASFPGLDLAALGHDGIVLKTHEETVFLAGGRPRGTLYAVNTFLEDVVGCRWWSARESDLPKRPTLEIPDLDTVYTPKLSYREAFYRDAFDGVHAARLKCNGHFERITPEYGGHYSLLGWCHTFYQLLPPETYFKEHPEWYSEIDGKRVGTGAQLCLTNEAMRAELTKNALAWIAGSPDAGMISIAQNDCGGRCTCPRCAAVEAEEGAPSGLLIRFVNSVAAEIEKSYPEVLVETLAYQYTREAPKQAKPRGNVTVRLCSIECSFSQPLATGPQNVDFARDIEAWSAISPKLYIWDYVTNFSNYVLPHPNMAVLASNIRFFVEHHAAGLFEQGDSGSTCGDFVELRAWLLAHLMWDPSRDAQALTAEFLQGYYGAAAGPLQAYLDLMQEAVGQSGAALRCFMPDTASWLTPDAMKRAAVLFDEAAQRVAEDPVRRDRVRRARLPLDHAWLIRYAALQREARLRQQPFDGPSDPVAFCEEFIKTAERFDAGCYSEGTPFSAYAPRLRARFRPPAAPPAECAGLPDSAWVDIQDNAFGLFGEGTQSAVVADAVASDGFSARMPGDHNQWAVQFPVSGEFEALGTARVYLWARCSAKTFAGNAFQAGIYDAEGKVPVAQTLVTIGQAGGAGYHRIDLGAHALRPGMYVWVAPMNNPEAVEAVLVDRIVFVKEK